MHQRPAHDHQTTTVLRAIIAIAVAHQHRRPTHQHTQRVSAALLIGARIVAADRHRQLPQPSIESPRLLGRDTPQDAGHPVLGSTDPDKPVGEGASPAFP